jgi:hypothetical protein
MSLRLISYRGGIVNFSIPSGWVEEYEPDGGAVFYEDSPNSGTLRLNVITFESPDGIDAVAISDNFRDSARGEVFHLPNGNVIQKYTKSAIDDAVEIVIYYWEVGNPVPPTSGRIAIFSYTILSSQVKDAKTKEEVSLLEREVMEATFSQILGE